MAVVTTDLSCLLQAAARTEVQAALEELSKQGELEVQAVALEPMNFTCEPDNMLINQYASIHGQVPPTLELHRLLVQSETALALPAVTQAVVACLPADTFWYGTTITGVVDAAVQAACQIPPRN